MYIAPGTENSSGATLAECTFLLVELVGQCSWMQHLFVFLSEKLALQITKA